MKGEISFEEFISNSNSVLADQKAKGNYHMLAPGKIPADELARCKMHAI
jgi:hypothetical protein